ANLGRLEAQSKLHIPTRIYVTQSAAQRLTNLQAAAQAGYQLVFATGFSQFDALGKVSFAFPKTDFAGIDVPNSIVAGHPQNVKGLVFHEEQAGYLVGYIAGLTVKRQGGKQVIGAVGANKVVAIALFKTGQAFVKNPASFKGGPGYDEYFPVAVGTISKKVPASDLAKFKAIQAQVLSGKIKVPSAF